MVRQQEEAGERAGREKRQYGKQQGWSREKNKQAEKKCEKMPRNIIYESRREHHDRVATSKQITNTVKQIRPFFLYTTFLFCFSSHLKLIFAINLRSIRGFTVNLIKAACLRSALLCTAKAISHRFGSHNDQFISIGGY